MIDTPLPNISVKKAASKTAQKKVAATTTTKSTKKGTTLPTNTAEKFAELTQEILKRVEPLDCVDAFWIHGSRAAGTARENSDISYGFLVKKHSDYDTIRQACKDLITWHNSPGFYPEQHWEVGTWKKEKFTFKDITWFVATKEDLEPYHTIFSERISGKRQRHIEAFQETHLLEYQGQAQHIFINSDIIYDPKGLIAALKKKLQAYPDGVSRGVKNWALGRLLRRLPWHGTPWIPRNKFQFIIDIKEDLYYIAIAHYALNKTFMENGLKHYEEDLKTFEPDIREYLDKLLAIDEKSLQEDKRPIMDEILHLLNREEDDF